MLRRGSVESRDERTVQAMKSQMGRSRGLRRKQARRVTMARNSQPTPVSASAISAPAIECGAKIAYRIKPASARRVPARAAVDDSAPALTERERFPLCGVGRFNFNENFAENQVQK